MLVDKLVSLLLVFKGGKELPKKVSEVGNPSDALLRLFLHLVT